MIVYACIKCQKEYDIAGYVNDNNFNNPLPMYPNAILVSR